METESNQPAALSGPDIAVIYAQVHLMDMGETLRRIRRYVRIERRVLGQFQKADLPHPLLSIVFGRLIKRDERLEQEINDLRQTLAKTNALLEHSQKPPPERATVEKAA